MSSQYQGTPPEEVTVETLPTDFVSGVTALFGHGCGQRLLRGKHGITAFELLEPKTPGTERRICVVSHGLGQCHGRYSDWALVTSMQDAGYTVLPFSFYGHGWSFAGDEVIGKGGGCCGGPVPEYDSPVFLTQVQELLTHVLKPGEPVDLWVGHSTGGLLGVYVAQTDVWPVRNLGLISPAFWAEKPSLGLAVENSNFLKHLFLNSNLVMAVENEMLLNNDKACIKNKSGGYIYPECHKKLAEETKMKFKHHPQVPKALGAISTTFLKVTQMPEHRSLFKDLAQRKEGPDKIVMVWGTGDLVVPYKHAAEVVAWNPTRVKLIAPEMGHESPFEDPKHVAGLLLDGLKAQ